MDLFQKIEKIREDNKLGVTDFLSESGMSKTSYYALRDGKTKTITAKTINKIIKSFPNYTYQWLNEDSQNVLLKNEDLEELAEALIQNEQELMKIPVFKYWFEAKVYKKATEVLKSHL